MKDMFRSTANGLYNNIEQLLYSICFGQSWSSFMLCCSNYEKQTERCPLQRLGLVKSSKYRRK